MKKKLKKLGMAIGGSFAMLFGAWASIIAFSEKAVSNLGAQAASKTIPDWVIGFTMAQTGVTSISDVTDAATGLVTSNIPGLSYFIGAVIAVFVAGLLVRRLLKAGS